MQNFTFFKHTILYLINFYCYFATPGLVTAFFQNNLSNRYQKGKTSLDRSKRWCFGMQWDDMQVICTSLQTDNHPSTWSLNWGADKLCKFDAGELQRLEDALRKFSCAVWTIVLYTLNCQHVITRISRILTFHGLIPLCSEMQVLILSPAKSVYCVNGNKNK